MSQLTYRSSVYRGAYAAIFAGVYLLLTAYLLSGDDSGSETSAGVWRLVAGLLLACVLGALAGPGLHGKLFKHRMHTQTHRKRRKRSAP